MPRIPRQALFLAVGLLAASQSGNIIRLGDAPALVMAAWRLLLASALLLPFAARQRGALGGLGRREILLLGLAGLALAGHLATWIAGVQHTSVASAMLVFAINPVFTASAALFLGERPSRRLALSIGCGLAGVAIMGWGDLGLSSQYALGDALALLSALLFSGYFLVGRHLRQALPNTLYVAVLYGVAGLCCLAASIGLDLPLLAPDARTWACFALLALVPTLIGHSALNHALAWLGASRVAAATLVEPLLGGAVAILVWDEPFGPATVAGYALIAASVLALVLERRPGGGAEA